MPAAAVRSSGGTTAMVYDWRVGTSICEIEMRARYSSTADVAVGISGTSASSTFEGRCVNTIVFNSPIRRAIQLAPNSESAERTLAAKKNGPSCSAPNPQRRWNQYETMLVETNPPANASRPNSAERPATRPADRPTPEKRLTPSTLASSTRSERRREHAHAAVGRRGAATERRAVPLASVAPALAEAGDGGRV